MSNRNFTNANCGAGSYTGDTPQDRCGQKMDGHQFSDKIVPTLQADQASDKNDHTKYAANSQLLDVYMKAKESVVAINSTLGPSSHEHGNGFFFTGDGKILTRLHIVDGAKDISVDTASGKHLKAKVESVDRDMDLAVLSVRTDTPVRALQLADESELNTGTPAVAVGFPETWGKMFASPGYYGTTNLLVDYLPRLDKSQLSPGQKTLLPVDSFVMHTRQGECGAPILNMKGQVIDLAAFTDAAVGQPTGHTTIATGLEAIKKMLKPYLPQIK